MRLNPVPFVFAPGAILTGYLVSGGAGVLVGLGLWGGVVAGATYASYRRHRAESDARPPQVARNPLSLRHR